MTKTTQMVSSLTENGQDFEWYPTTNAMINAVKRWIPEDADSILDVGAGDGKVLLNFSDKCKYAKLFSIEISAVLTQAQPDSIIPIGTNVYEQNLSHLQVDYIFCNPPYSEFEEWACKIIEEGYARKAYLVIPQRWKNSETISKALELRGAETGVLYSGDFNNAERRARAVIDIVEIRFPAEKYGRQEVIDPFEIWFDHNIDTFDKAETIKEDETDKDLARRFSSANIGEMVEAYLAEFSILESNYRAVFKLDYMVLHELGINKTAVREGLKMKMKGLKVKYWQILFTRIDAITSRLTTSSKKKLLDKLTRNMSVEFTASNAYTVVLWAIKNANQYFDSQLVDLFFALTEVDSIHVYKSNTKTWVMSGWRYNNHDRKNTHYALDYRIVLGGQNAIPRSSDHKWEHPGNLHKDSHNKIADIIAVMANLGFSTFSENSLDRQWKGGRWENFYEANTDEILFQVKGYMNGNLHFRFKQSAIKALNIEAGRLLKWVQSEEEVVTEMGYTPEEAKQYFQRNSHILPSNVKLLNG